mmetsp:Transcript_45700/g.97618  ORF Transcript_45700/g.97618 Transcript_45700/m.97618 type:complete len:124 (-) Transcript_45700:1026-1397(-)
MEVLGMGSDSDRRQPRQHSQWRENHFLPSAHLACSEGVVGQDNGWRSWGWNQTLAVGNHGSTSNGERITSFRVSGGTPPPLYAPRMLPALGLLPLCAVAADVRVHPLAFCMTACFICAFFFIR